MQKNKLLQGLLGVSVVAAIFASAGVQAQSSSAATSPSTTPKTGQSQTGDTAGKPSTATSGMAGQQGSSGTTGTSGTSGDTGTAAQSSGTSGTAGTTGATMTPSTATTAATGSVSKADQKIVTELAAGNMAEIELAKLAQSKTQNDQVKSFAQQMIDDHTKALTDVQTLAQAKGVTLPASLDKQHQAESDKLAKLSGDAFDKAYMSRAGVTDHKQMHSKLASAEKKAKDPDVKALVAKIMPTVDQHLNAAQQANTAVGSSGKSKTGSGNK